MERWKNRSARDGMWFIQHPSAMNAMMVRPSLLWSHREMLPRLELGFLIMVVGLGAILNGPL